MGKEKIGAPGVTGIFCGNSVRCVDCSGASDRVSITEPLPYPPSVQVSPEQRPKDVPSSGQLISGSDSALLWHFLSGISELNSRIDSAFLSDIKNFGRIPDPAIREVLSAVQELSHLAKALLCELPALSSHLSRSTVKVLKGAGDAE